MAHIEETNEEAYANGYRDRMNVAAEHGQKALFAALAKAQSDLKAVEKGSRNDYHGYAYASAEDMMSAATAVMGVHGLAFVCIGSSFDKQAQTVTAEYILTHEDGAHMALGSHELTVHPDKGRPMDKAISTALTYLQAYTLRSCFNIPRVPEGTERDSMQDQAIQAWAKDGAKLAKKVETAYGKLWVAAKDFFDTSMVPRPRNAEGAEMFKKWVAWAAHPEREYPQEDRGEQLLSLQLAANALKAWKKSTTEDQAQECSDFATEAGHAWPTKSKTEQAADAAFELSLEGEG